METATGDVRIINMSAQMTVTDTVHNKVIGQEVVAVVQNIETTFNPVSISKRLAPKSPVNVT